MKTIRFILFAAVAFFAFFLAKPVFATDLQNGIYIITSEVGPRSLDVQGGSTSICANIQIYRTNNSNAQKFYLEKSGKYYRIRNVLSGLVLDVQGGSGADGANVRQYIWNNSAAQKWSLVDAGGGAYYILNAGSGKALDVRGGINADKTNVRQYRLNRTRAQKWKLKKVTAKGLPSNKNRYVVTCNRNYTNNYNILGRYDSLASAVASINRQPSSTKGQWFVLDTSNKKVVWPDLSTAGKKISKAVAWAHAVANDPKHGYSCDGELSASGNLNIKSGRWGVNGDYSCSTLPMSAYDVVSFCDFKAVAKKNNIRMNGYVGLNSFNVIKAIEKSGKFRNISSDYARLGNSALRPGDMVLTPNQGHCAIYIGSGQFVEATCNENGQEYGQGRPGDQNGIEIRIKVKGGWGFAFRPKN